MEALPREVAAALRVVGEIASIASDEDVPRFLQFVQIETQPGLGAYLRGQLELAGADPNEWIQQLVWSAVLVEHSGWRWRLEPPAGLVRVVRALEPPAEASRPSSPPAPSSPPKHRRPAFRRQLAARRK